MRASLLLIFTVGLLTAACDSPSSPPDAWVVTQSSSASSGTRMDATSMPSALTSRTAFENAIREGMGYADFRSRILDLGWQPLPDAQCKQNIVGDPAKCKGNSDLALCRACDEIPELGSYSGDGHSLSRFRHPNGQQVSVSALGELKYWKMPGDDPGLAITGWTFGGGDAPHE